MAKSRKEKIYLALIITVVLAIAAVLAVGLSGCEAEGSNAIPAHTPRPSSEVVVKKIEKIVEVEKKVSAETIEDGLKDMGELITEEYYFTEVVSFSSVKKLFKANLKFTESSFLASYDGVVRAGIDFGEIRVEKDEDAGRIRIYIPAAKIIGVDIDPASFELYSEKTGIGNPISVEDFNQSLVELESTAGEKAVDKGMLKRADENARRVIANFVGSLIDRTEYTLEYITL